jgi:hypothetical protein
MTGFSLTHPDKLPDPLPIALVAKLQGVSLVTVYASTHRFLAAARNDDIEAMRHAIPCYMEGGTTDAAGNRKGGPASSSRAMPSWPTTGRPRWAWRPCGSSTATRPST